MIGFGFPATLAPPAQTTTPALSLWAAAPVRVAGPEVGLSSSPNIYKAIEFAQAQFRMPDRGSAVIRQGVVLTMPDGSKGGRPVTPKPILSRLSGFAREVVKTGGTPQVRQTMLANVRQKAYANRQAGANKKALLGLTPFAMGLAKGRRLKGGTPTGVVGDRALNMLRQRRAFLYSSQVAPASTVISTAGARTGGAGTAAAPIAAPKPALEVTGHSLTEALARQYRWSNPKAETTPLAAPAAGVVAQEPAKQAERILLLAAVAGAAFLLLRG